MSRARMAKSFWSGAIPLLLAAVAAAACSTSGYAAKPVGSECYSEDFAGDRDKFETESFRSRLSYIADNCAKQAGSSTARRRETLYANFYAGKAGRIFGENPGLRAPGDPVWATAETALRDVVNFTGDRARPGSPPADLMFELTRIEAELELAQVLRDRQSNREAVVHANNAADAYKGFNNLTPIPAIRARATSGLVNASLVKARISGYPDTPSLAALVALQEVFIDPALDGDVKARGARKYIVETANTLGSIQVDEGTQESFGVAQNYFGRGLDAARAAYRANRTAENGQAVADSLVNIGRVSMSLASRAGPTKTGGCEPITADLSQVRTALGYFSEALQVAPGAANALQWRGCAQMASGDLSSAVQSFIDAKDAARTARADTSAMQLSLGRGLYRLAVDQGAANRWAEARTAFKAALDEMRTRNADAEARARVQLEFAKFDLEYAKTRFASPSKQTLTDEAFGNLNDAIRRNLPEANLLAAAIQIDKGDYGGAQTNIANALTAPGGSNPTALRAEAFYLRGKLEMQREEKLHKGNFAVAAENADRAADMGENSPDNAPIYFAQACEARLLFNNTRGGDKYCRALEVRDQNNYNEALLREGMYYLSVGARASSRARGAAYDAAYSAFDRGVKRLEGSGSAAGGQLLANLLVGKGIAMECSGLKSVGLEVRRSVDTQFRSDATSMFQKYQLLQCRT